MIRRNENKQLIARQKTIFAELCNDTELVDLCEA